MRLHRATRLRGSVGGADNGVNLRPYIKNLARQERPGARELLFEVEVKRHQVLFPILTFYHLNTVEAREPAALVRERVHQEAQE